MKKETQKAVDDVIDSAYARAKEESLSLSVEYGTDGVTGYTFG
jgi:hypothetical protein